MKKVFSMTALVTGATSGIGLELCRLFSRDGYSLIIVARDEYGLNVVAEELRSAGAPAVHVFAKDLSKERSAEALYLDITQAGLTVDILVNDAAAAQRGLFAETSLDADLGIMQLNVVSVVTLTKLFLTAMIRNKSGLILQLASVESYQPTPTLAVYSATKAFVLSFTDSLAAELDGTGVFVTALIPGPTRTPFLKSSGIAGSRAASHPEEPASVAKRGYKALMKHKRHVTGTGVKKKILRSSVLSNSKLAQLAGKEMEKIKVHGNKKAKAKKRGQNS